MREIAVTTTGQTLRAQLSTSSPVRAYQDLVVGSHRWAALLRYELFAAWMGLLPGALGLVLRKWFWKGLLGRSGRGVLWGRSVVLRHPGKMWIDDGAIIDDACYLDAKGSAPGEFRIGAYAMVSRESILSAKDGTLVIGARANVGARCVLYASNRLEIGADTMLAAHCYVGGGRYDTHGRVDVPLSEQHLPRLGVSIGNDCWIGAGVVVVDGVSIGHGSVVGAGAVVTSDLPPYSIAVGVPAKIVGSRLPAVREARA